jgi:transposase
MRKNSNTPGSSKRVVKARKTDRMTIGMDLGDKKSRICMLDEAGEVIREASVATTKKGMAQTFGAMAHCRIALEVGTHSPWVSRLLKSFGHEVIVANARQVKLISQSSRKDDKLDAQMLARLARVDPQLLRPIRHRSEEAQADLITIRIRAALVEARTGLVNAARGLTKASGERLPKCDADQMGEEQLAEVPAELAETLKPLLKEVESLTERIQECDRKIEQIARDRYPETKLLRQVSGVGPLIALTFILTIEDKERFEKSRDVGCYVGLRPKRSESGERQPELRITKEGDVYLRKLLVQGAHCILKEKAPDTDLKRWGTKLAARGGKNAKKRALVAVVTTGETAWSTLSWIRRPVRLRQWPKLAVLLHHLWATGEVYEPLRNNKTPEKKAA